MPQGDDSLADLYEFSLPFQAESAGEARRRLDSWLSSGETEADPREDVRLVISELVGNAVRHASPLADGTMLIGAQRNGEHIDIHVRDGGGSTDPIRQDAGVSDLSGRGLAIVEAITQRWWVERGDSGTTVHAVVPLAARP